MRTLGHSGSNQPVKKYLNLKIVFFFYGFLAAPGKYTIEKIFNV